MGTKIRPRPTVATTTARASMDPRREADALSGQTKPDWSLDEAIRAHLIQVLRMTRGKIYGKSGAAQFLGLKPSTLQAKLKKLGLDRKLVAGRTS